MESSGVRKGRARVVLLDENREAVAVTKASYQVEDDPFSGTSMTGLVEPPINLQQLAFLADAHPLHSSAIEQKVADVVGEKLTWTPKVDDADEKQKDALDAWWTGLFGDEMSPHEVISAVWEDVETLNLGYLEVSRGPSGTVQGLYHVPASTVRWHNDGKRLVQITGTGVKRVWFARWGALGKNEWVDRRYGTIKVGEPDPANRANELLVIRKNAKRGPYGIPRYISALGWVTLGVSVRDDNLHFFANRREPRWAIIISNIEDDDNIEEDLRQAMTVDLQQPHRNLLIPISGPGKIDFQQLSNLSDSDGSFEKLEGRCDAKILVAHRVPPERLGMTRVGPLGGNVALASSRIYREAVISPSQAILSSRLNRFIKAEYALQENVTDLASILWRLLPDELDLSEEAQDVDSTETLFTSNIMLLKEARKRMDLPDLDEKDERNDMLFIQLESRYPKATSATVAATKALRDHAHDVQRLRDEIRSELDHTRNDDGSGTPDPAL